MIWICELLSGGLALYGELGVLRPHCTFLFFSFFLFFSDLKHSSPFNRFPLIEVGLDWVNTQ